MSTLYVVATPIGNLGDLTSRATETLGKVDFVLAEDTRRTLGLLSHLGLKKRLTRLDANATPAQITAVVLELTSGKSAALCTDAGVPGVSDPGARLVSEARAQGVTIVPIPGPSAVTALISVSGFVDGAFGFLGFLPRQGKKRAKVLDRIVASGDAVVFFESAERVRDTLRELSERAPDRQLVIGRELTKLHEEIVCATLAECVALEREWVGELTLIVAGAPETEPEELDAEDLKPEILLRLQAAESARDIATDLAARLEQPRRKIYEIVEQVKRALETG